MKIKNILESEGDFFARKYIFEKEGKTVESTYIDKVNKEIICVSNMFGCPVKCKFCASGSNYFGNLNKDDISDMIFKIVEGEDISHNRKLLISFMGSGEPLLNLGPIKDNIKLMSRIFTNSYFAISMSGVKIDNLNRLNELDGIDINLKFSLHSPYDSQRRQIIPRTDSLDKIINVLSDSPFPVELNYCVLDKFNDSDKHAKDLAVLIKDTNFNLKINKYHQIGNSFIESKNKGKFIAALEKNGVDFEVYTTDGADINGACGQLTSQLLI
jgi:23S rRNA (adenine2503-C2)-methyltransferase